jgi:hypothetical protein
MRWLNMHVKVQMDDFMQAQEAATESSHFHPTQGKFPFGFS